MKGQDSVHEGTGYQSTKEQDLSARRGRISVHGGAGSQCTKGQDLRISLFV